MEVVRGVNLEVKPDSVLCLVGESGSGKTMTAMACMGQLPAGARVAGGCVKLGTAQIVPGCERIMRGIRGGTVSMIMQNPMACFHPMRTIGAHFAETLRIHQGLSRKEARQVAEERMRRVALSDPAGMLDRYPFQFSGGQLQRIMIALAMSTSPQVLIADEPTTALDASNQKRVLQLLHDVRKESGAGLLLITHDLGVVAEVADFVAVMYGGEIVETAPVKKFFHHPQHEYTRRLLESRIQLKRSARQMAARGT
nr:ABC transporter ATP-binding protein [Cohnella sp. REN36]